VFQLIWSEVTKFVKISTVVGSVLYTLHSTYTVEGMHLDHEKNKEQKREHNQEHACKVEKIQHENETDSWSSSNVEA